AIIWRGRIVVARSDGVQSPLTKQPRCDHVFSGRPMRAPKPENRPAKAEEPAYSPRWRDAGYGERLPAYRQRRRGSLSADARLRPARSRHETAVPDRAHLG